MARVSHGAIGVLVLAALASSPASAAGPFTLGQDLAFRNGALCIRVEPAGTVRVLAGETELATWNCLLELTGALRCTTAAESLANAQRQADTAAGVVTVSGDIRTLDGAQTIRYTQVLRAVPDGLRVDVQFSLPDGKDALALMQNRRRPFGLMILPGDGYADAPWRVSTKDGREVSGALPREPSRQQANAVPQGLSVQSMTVWHPGAKLGFGVAPGAGCYVELLDFRRWGNVFRLNVHPDTDRTEFSLTLTGPAPLNLPPCSVGDATLESSDLAYLFAAGRPAALKVRLVSNRDAPQTVSVDWRVEPWPDGAPLSGRETVALGPRETQVVTVLADLPRRGLYRFTARAASAGTACGSVRFGLASIVDLPSLPETPPETHFGFQGTPTPGVAQLGLKWYLPVLPGWDRVELEKGKLDWREVDEIMAYCRRLGFAVIACVGGTPEWASSLRNTASFDDLVHKYAADPAGFDAIVLACGGLKPIQRRYVVHDTHVKSVPADWADYRNFLRAFIHRYRDQVHHVTAGNEIDGCNGFFGSPREYVEFLRQTWDTVKAVDPAIQVLGIGSYSYTPTPFARAVFAAGGARYMDIYHWHPYYEAGAWEVHVREQLAEAMASGRQLAGWCTEFGNPPPPKVDSLPMGEAAYDAALQQTADGHPPSKFFSVGFGANLVRVGGKLCFAPNGPICLPEAEQARSLLRFYATLIGEGVQTFTIHSGCPLIMDREPTAAAVAQAMASRTLGLAKPLRRLESASPHFRGYLYQAPEGRVAVCWTQAEAETVALRPAGDGVRVADLYGNPVAPEMHQGLLTVALTGAPVYLLNADEHLAVADPVADLSFALSAAAAAGDRVPLRVRFRNALAEPLTASVVAAPTDASWGGEVRSPQLTVAAGAATEVTLEIAVPTDAAPGLHSLRVTVACRAGALNTAVVNRVALAVMTPRPCPPAPAEFAVDGDLHEWLAREPSRLDRATQITWQTDELLSQFNRLWQGPADLSARVWYAWSPAALCVALAVEDNDVQTLGSPAGREYMGDCVELFLDGRPGGFQAEYGAGVHQGLWVPPVTPGESGRVAVSGGVQGIEAAGRRTATGYSAEFRVPFSAANFPGFVAQPGALFGFTLALDDLDAGMGTTRKIQMALSGSARNHVDTSGFLRLCFGPAVFLTNQVANGGFEAGDAAAPAGWTVASGGAVVGGAAEGTRCLRLQRTPQGGARAAQTLVLEPERWYVLEFAHRTQGALGIAYAGIQGAGPAGAAAVYPAHYPIGASSTETWLRSGLQFYSTRGGPAELEFRLAVKPDIAEAGLPPEGSLWVDDVRVRAFLARDAEGECVENGDFEAGVPGAMPPGWSRGRSRERTPAVVVTDRERHAGRQAMEVVVGPAQEIAGLDAFAVMAGTRQLVPGRAYRLSFWAKAEREYAVQAALSGAVHIVRQCVLRPEWSHFEVPATMPVEPGLPAKGPRFVRLSIEGALKLGDVRFWVDDVSLRAE